MMERRDAQQFLHVESEGCHQDRHGEQNVDRHQNNRYNFGCAVRQIIVDG